MSLFLIHLITTNEEITCRIALPGVSQHVGTEEIGQETKRKKTTVTNGKCPWFPFAMYLRDVQVHAGFLPEDILGYSNIL